MLTTGNKIVDAILLWSLDCRSKTVGRPIFIITLLMTVVFGSNAMIQKVLNYETFKEMFSAYGVYSVNNRVICGVRIGAVLPLISYLTIFAFLFGLANMMIKHLFF